MLRLYLDMKTFSVLVRMSSTYLLETGFSTLVSIKIKSATDETLDALMKGALEVNLEHKYERTKTIYNFPKQRMHFHILIERV